jgi:hypothetical protein
MAFKNCLEIEGAVSKTVHAKHPALARSWSFLVIRFFADRLKIWAKDSGEFQAPYVRSGTHTTREM